MVRALCLLVVAVASLVASSAAHAQGPYSYQGQRDWVSHAVVAITDAQVTPGQEVSVYVGAVDEADSWIQAGVTVGAGVPGLCAYVEVHDGPSGANDLRCVQRVEYGQRVDVRVSFSYRHGWVAWVDGRPVARTALRRGIVTGASAETYLGARLAYVLQAR